jgi:hypothetical protein
MTKLIVVKSKGHDENAQKQAPRTGLSPCAVSVAAKRFSFLVSAATTAAAPALTTPRSRSRTRPGTLARWIEPNHVLSLETLWLFNHVELNPFPLIQHLESATLD